MTMDILFSIGNVIVLPAWAALAFLPFWKGTQIISGVVIPVLIGLAYVGLIFAGLFTPSGLAIDLGSIEGIRTLFSLDSAIVAGWFHYLAFDLFIGAWIVRDARRNEIPHWLVLPCLPFTFLFGPVGLVLYLIFRTASTRTLSLTD